MIENSPAEQIPAHQVWQVSIYALCEPGTDIVRYIGQKVNVGERYQAHVNSGRKVGPLREQWIYQLKQQGLKPTLKILETLPPMIAGFAAEYKWIKFYLGQGANLTNSHYEGSRRVHGDQRRKVRRHHHPAKRQAALDLREGTRGCETAHG